MASHRSKLLSSVGVVVLAGIAAVTGIPGAVGASSGTDDSTPGTGDPAGTNGSTGEAPSDAGASDAAIIDVDFPDQPPGVAWPTDEWVVGDLPADLDRSALDAATDTAFGAPDAQARVRSIIVVHGGEIVYERYHSLDSAETLMDSFSVAKSFTSALVGHLVGTDGLDIDAAVPRSEWPARDPRAEITWRDLLEMSSGLDYDEGRDVITMVQQPEVDHWMAERPLIEEPGTVFSYATGSTGLVVGSLADQYGGCEAIGARFADEILHPIGITDEQILNDPTGCWFGGFGANMTPRDFARFGLLYLRGGTWDGTEIVSERWVEESWTPSPANSSYGLQWWLEPARGAYRARGLFGQEIVVVPDHDLVVVVNTTQGGASEPLVDAALAAFGIGPAGDPSSDVAVAPEAATASTGSTGSTAGSAGSTVTNGSTAGSSESTVSNGWRSPASTDTTVPAPGGATTLPAPPPDPGNFDAPVLATTRTVADDLDVCTLLDPEAIYETPFGEVIEPGESVTMAGADSPGCRYPGVNVGEIAFAVVPSSTFVSTDFPDGTWEIIDGNTAFVYCRDDDETNVQACGAYLMLDRERLLNLAVILPTNDLNGLGDTVRQLATSAVEVLPTA